MKEQSLREALSQAARHDPAAGDPFSRFERIRRRNALIRGAVLFGIGVALMFAFAFVFPNPLRSGPPGEFPTGGELDPLPRTVRVFEDPVAGYQLSYPSEWRIRGELGDRITFYVDTDPPIGEASITDLFRRPDFIEEIPKTFFVQVTPLIEGNETLGLDRSRLAAISDAGAVVTTENVFPDEEGQRRRDAIRVFFAEQPIGDAERIKQWCRSCRYEEVTVVLRPDRGVPPLFVRIVAPDGVSFQQYRFDALSLLDSIERYIER